MPPAKDYLPQHVPLSVNTSYSSVTASQLDESLLSTEVTDSSLQKSKYRYDYSRSQHHQMSDSQRIAHRLPFNAENMSPEQIRFEKYVHRFAVHDPRASPLRRRREDGVPQSPTYARSVASAPTVTGRPTSNGQYKSEYWYTEVQDEANYPDPEPQLSTSSNSESFPQHPHQRVRAPSPQNFRSKSGSSQYEYIKHRVASGSTGTATTATTATISMESQRHRSPSLERRHVAPTTEASRQDSQVRASAPTTPSRRLPHSAPSTPTGRQQRDPAEYFNASRESSIETPSPARVREIRSKLWDNDETLNVSVRPSLHYESEQAPKAHSTAGVPTRPALSGPEMAGRQGHRTARSLSPNRPQYRNSQFKSRFYEAALASRRQSKNFELVRKARAQEAAQERMEQERYEHEYRQEEIPKPPSTPQRSPSLSYHARPPPMSQQRPLKTADAQQRSMWRPQSAPLSNAAEIERSGSEGTGESASVAKLVARLNAISRENPAEALARIDSILKAESKSSSERDAIGGPPQQVPERITEEKPVSKAEDVQEEDEDEDSDDETTVSSITNPTYVSEQARANMMGNANRPSKPNALKNYQHLGAVDADNKRISKQDRKDRPPPPDTIKVKDGSARENQQEKNETSGRLDVFVEKTKESADASSPAAIAMKIRMWDEMSNSAGASSRKKDELSTVLEEGELLSATTDELGSIVTPADAAAGISTSQQAKYARLDSLSSASQERQKVQPGASPDTAYSSRPRSSTPTDVDVTESQQRLRERGRDLARHSSRSRSPRERAPDRSESSLTPTRRHHPWDHHHPRNKQPTKGVDTSTDSSEGVELKPMKPPAEHQILNIRKETLAKPDVAAGGSLRRSNSTSSGFTGDIFEVDPKLLKPAEEFGLPERIKTASPSTFTDADAAWEALPPSAFISEIKNSNPRPQCDDQVPGRLRAPPERRRPSPGASQMHKGQNVFRSQTDPVIKAGQDDEETASLRSRSKSPGRRKLNFLKIRAKSREEGDYDATASLCDQPVSSDTYGEQRAQSKSPGRLGNKSPSRERSGSYNIVKKFSRLRRPQSSLGTEC